jgi:hypothetical protein
MANTFLGMFKVKIMEHMSGILQVCSACIIKTETERLWACSASFSKKGVVWDQRKGHFADVLI